MFDPQFHLRMSLFLRQINPQKSAKLEVSRMNQIRRDYAETIKPLLLDELAVSVDENLLSCCEHS